MTVSENGVRVTGVTERKVGEREGGEEGEGTGRGGGNGEKEGEGESEKEKNREG